jgi:2-polyprenyl-6-hydroxyphenyl methylase/3-demethylubiquinone-9 3-methyltransferase
MTMNPESSKSLPTLDTQGRDEFYEYYAEASLSEVTLDRYRHIQDTILRFIPDALPEKPLDIVDIGCGGGSQSMLWAEKGHRVRGIDVNQRLLDLARARSADRKLEISFAVGTAASLPWPDQSADVCILPELLEHVVEWHACLSEAARVLRPGGVLFLTTTNWICPIQQEFNLPLYSWYPGPLKRRFERLAKTTRPELANYATYPAVNWFSFHELRAALAPMGFRCLDRFQTAADPGRGGKHLLLLALRNVQLLRTIAQLASPYSQVLAIKQSHG